MVTCTLREAMTLASDGRDINFLCSLMRETSLHPPANNWILTYITLDRILQGQSLRLFERPLN